MIRLVKVTLSLNSMCMKKDFDLPHLVMTYTAILSLGILRDDFSKLDKKGLIRMMRCSQNEDGRY